jgi:hypothetical protein
MARWLLFIFVSLLTIRTGIRSNPGNTSKIYSFNQFQTESTASWFHVLILILMIIYIIIVVFRSQVGLVLLEGLRELPQLDPSRPSSPVSSQGTINQDESVTLNFHVNETIFSHVSSLPRPSLFALNLFQEVAVSRTHVVVLTTGNVFWIVEDIIMLVIATFIDQILSVRLAIYWNWWLFFVLVGSQSWWHSPGARYRDLP